MNKFILIVLFAFFALSFANLSPMEALLKLKEININAHIKESFTRVTTALQAYAKENQVEMIKKSILAERFTPAPATNCSSALSNLLAVLGSSDCAQAVGTIFTSSDPNAIGTAVATYCGTCLTHLKNGLKAVGQFCPISDRAADDFRRVIFYNNFLCSRSGDTYCAPQLLGALSAADNLNFETITASDLNQICTPCTVVALTALTSAGLAPVPTALLELRLLSAFCFKLNNEYCAVRIGNDIKNIQPILARLQGNQLPSKDDFIKILDVTCSPCFRGFLGRLFFLSPNIPLREVISSLGGLCRRKNRKTYCLAEIVEKSPSPLLAAMAGTEPCANLTANACPAACKNVIDTLVDKVGCCWALFADFSGIEPGTFAGILRPCRENIPVACPSFFRAKVTITYLNIAAAWFSDPANRQAFLTAFAADLAFQTQGNVSDPSATQGQKRDGEVVASATVTTVASAGDIVTTTSAECVNVCGLTSASSDPSQPISTSTKSVSNVEVQSSASALSFSIVLLSLASIVALLF